MAWGRRQANVARILGELESETDLRRSRLASETQLGVAKITSNAAAERQRTGIAAAKETATRRPLAEVPYLPESRERGAMGKIMGASPKELRGIYDRMPVETKPIHTIRGTEQGYWNPSTKREYGSLRSAMTGFRQRPAELRSSERMSEAGLKSTERVEKAREAGLMSRAAMGENERMTPYQKATLSQGKRNFELKLNQARTKDVNAKMEPWLAGEGFKSSLIEQEVRANYFSNRWDEANLPPEQARKLISRRPVKLRRNKRTGEERWFNAYGEMIEDEQEEEEPPSMTNIKRRGFVG